MLTVAEVYERCCVNRFKLPTKTGLPTETELRSIERRLKNKLPADYRAFLSCFNGGEFRGAVIVFPEPITVAWRDGVVTHSEVRLRVLNGVHAAFEAAELAKPSDLSLFDNNDPVQLLPIGYTSMGCLLLLDMLPSNEGDILIKFPSEKAYFVANGIDGFFGLIEVRQEE